jgi:hypothetical protein
MMFFTAATLLPVVLAGSLAGRAVDPPRALPERAIEGDRRWQPSLDFDKDGCYNVPAIDQWGNLAQGLSIHPITSPSGDCRDLSDLNNNNVYARQRCNNGWCAHAYAYYFEKDVPGHTHDWEHIVIWARDGRIQYVAVSAHGSYTVKHISEVRVDGEHPKVVYHKDGGSTHAFRFANSDDDNIENHTRHWFRGAVVSWNGFPNEDIRYKMANHDWGKANFDLREAGFPNLLQQSMPDGIIFDRFRDEGSPGWP